MMQDLHKHTNLTSPHTVAISLCLPVRPNKNIPARPKQKTTPRPLAT